VAEGRLEEPEMIPSPRSLQFPLHLLQFSHVRDETSRLDTRLEGSRWGAPFFHGRLTDGPKTCHVLT
jgi:hypothetical protein